MYWTSWRVCAVAALFGLAVLTNARAEENKPIDEGKAEKFKSKAYDVKEKGEVAILLDVTGGQKVNFTVKSEKKSDINLFVYNKGGKLIDKDDSPGPDCDLTITFKDDGKYKIVIRNLGPGDNRSTLKVDVSKPTDTDKDKDKDK